SCTRGGLAQPAARPRLPVRHRRRPGAPRSGPGYPDAACSRGSHPGARSQRARPQCVRHQRPRPPPLRPVRLHRHRVHPLGRPVAGGVTESALDTTRLLSRVGPVIVISRPYTRTGDAGQTRLSDMSKTAKTDPRVAAYGEVDEANATIGLVVTTPDCPEDIAAVLSHIQNELFDVGADLSTPLV